MTGSSKASALRFVLAVGVVNLFADFAYEGGRSLTGAFLGVLGASATIVGVTAGAGEAIGYAVRSLSGVIADRTQRYWIEIAVGYASVGVRAARLLRRPELAVAGVVLWGVGMGAQESLFLATFANITRDEKKATSFGVYDTFYGVAWFLGSALLGFLYDRSLTALVIFAVVTQLAAIPFFVASVVRSRAKTRGEA